MILSSCLASPAVLALPVAQDTIIDSSAPLQGYELKPGVTLTANGAAIKVIKLSAGSALHFNNGTISGSDGLSMVSTAAGTEVKISGSTVDNQGSGNAIRCQQRRERQR